MNVQQLVATYREEAIALRREIHSHPELGFEEFKTAALIRSELLRYGITEIQEVPNCPTCITAVIRGKHPGKTVGLREDIDALPLVEASGLPFSSQTDGVCHACGHDIHTVSLLLAAQVLNEKKDELHGNIRLIFQPAEEKVTGAQLLIQNGIMELEPKIDVIVGVHVSPEYAAGSIGLIKGSANASTDALTITVRGKGGHGAHPYRCVDPIATTAYLLTQLQTVISRENPALQPAVLTFGSIHGGTAPNIIPGEVTIKGTLRAFHETGRRKMWDAIRRISKGCCEAMRAEADVIIQEGVPALINSPEVIDGVAAAAAKTIGAEKIHWLENPSPGSDDFSCFLDFCPGAQFRVGSCSENEQSKIGLHNPANIFEEEAIPTAATVMAQYALDFLSK